MEGIANRNQSGVEDLVSRRPGKERAQIPSPSRDCRPQSKCTSSSGVRHDQRSGRRTQLYSASESDEYVHRREGRGKGSRHRHQQQQSARSMSSETPEPDGSSHDGTPALRGYSASLWRDSGSRSMRRGRSVGEDYSDYSESSESSGMRGGRGTKLKESKAVQGKHEFDSSDERGENKNGKGNINASRESGKD